MATNQINNQVVSQNVWANLVIAMLSVNQYPVEKTWTIFDQLKANGLFDPLNFGKWNYVELYNRLNDSNYNRGKMMPIFIERLLSLSNLLGDVKKNENILATGTKDEVSELLKKVKGVGPVVINTFFLIRGK